MQKRVVYYLDNCVLSGEFVVVHRLWQTKGFYGEYFYSIYHWQQLKAVAFRQQLQPSVYNATNKIPVWKKFYKYHVNIFFNYFFLNLI